MGPEKYSNYKTEEQLKREAKERLAAEAAALAARPASELQKKRENFWYHYKWHTIIGVFAAVLAAVFIKDMFLTPKPDATIVMVAESYYFADDTELLAAAIEEKTGGAGSGASVLIDYIPFPAKESDGAIAGQDPAITMKLMTVLAAGADPIYLLDEAAYRHIVEMGLTEDDAPGTDNIFEPKSVPAEGLGEKFAGLRFYLRKNVGGSDEYRERCEKLLKTINGG